MEKIVDHLKRKWMLYLFVIASVWCLLSFLVYGQVSLTKPLRSQFMREVIVKTITAIITFGGIAYSINKTIEDNSKRQEQQLIDENSRLEKRNIHEHGLKIKELETQERINNRDRELLIKQDIIKAKLSRNEFLKDNVSNYKKLNELISKNLLYVSKLEETEEFFSEIDYIKDEFVEVSKNLALSMSSTDRLIDFKNLKQDINDFAVKVQRISSDFKSYEIFEKDKSELEKIKTSAYNLKNESYRVGQEVESYLSMEWDLIIGELEELIIS